MNKTTEIVFEKTLHFPTACVGVGKGQGFKTVKVNIRLAKQICKDWKTLEEKQMYVFTASASGKGRCGQCLDFIQENAEKYMIPEERRALYNRIYKIWSEYHLNDLQAGTEKQTALLTKEQCRIDNYEKACETLKHFGLLEDRGHKYGHGWLCKEIPVEVIAEIMTWKDVEDLGKLEIEKIRRKAQYERVAR